MKTSDLVKNIISDELSVDEIIVTPEARFVEDLGADSLDVVELVMRFEEEFELEILDEEAEQLATVGGVMNYLQDKVGDSFDAKSISQCEKVVSIQKKLEAAGEFTPTNDVDSRERVLSSIVRRRGQSDFRQVLLKIYNQQCAITGYSAVEALEAAHISPFRGEHTDHPTNGLLLRADIHTLFDLHLIGIDTKTMTILLSPQLQSTSYHYLAGKPLRLPKNETFHPSKAALDEHRKQSGL